MKSVDIPCDKCALHETCYTVGMRGLISGSLCIVLDGPSGEEDKRHKTGYSRNFEMLKYILARMSITMDQVSIIYALRCWRPKNAMKKKPDRMLAYLHCSVHTFALLQEHPMKAIVAMGTLAVEALFGGAKVGDKEGVSWKSKMLARDVWATYSPGYAIESPAETGRLYRVLWHAAIEAGLKPKSNTDVAPFDYGY